jgi:hypothetical protein
MTLAVLAGYGAARILARWPGKRVFLITLLLTAALVDVWPQLDVTPVWKAPPEIYHAIPEGPNTVVADLPVRRGKDGESFAVRYMYFSTFHWHTLVDGNSGWAPPSWLEYVEAMGDFPATEALDYLRTRGVQYFAVHGAFYENPEDFQRIQRVLELRPDVERVTASAFSGGTSELYRFRQ